MAGIDEIVYHIRQENATETDNLAMERVGNFFSNWFSWLSVATNKPGTLWILTALILGAIIAVTPRTWLHTRLFATYIHEAGHAVIAIVTGRKVKSMRIEGDSSGSTLHAGLQNAVFSRFLTALAGYPAPAIVGWAMIVSITSGHARYALGALFLVVLSLALLQHSLRGLAVTFIILAVSWGLTLVNNFIMQMIICLVAGYLLIASPRTIVELHKVGRQRKHALGEENPLHSDAQALADMTGLGVLIWEFLFMTACLALIWFSLVRLGIV